MQALPPAIVPRTKPLYKYSNFFVATDTTNEVNHTPTKSSTIHFHSNIHFNLSHYIFFQIKIHLVFDEKYIWEIIFGRNVKESLSLQRDFYE
jgi:hypothetical protein